MQQTSILNYPQYTTKSSWITFLQHPNPQPIPSSHHHNKSLNPHQNNDSLQNIHIQNQDPSNININKKHHHTQSHQLKMQNKTFDSNNNNNNTNNSRNGYRIQDFLPKPVPVSKKQQKMIGSLPLQILKSSRQIQNNKIYKVKQNINQNQSFFKQQVKSNINNKFKNSQGFRNQSFNNNNNNVQKQDNNTNNLVEQYTSSVQNQIKNTTKNIKNQDNKKIIQQAIKNAFKNRTQNLQKKMGWSQRIQIAIIPQTKSYKTLHTQTIQQLQSLKSMQLIDNLKTKRQNTNMSNVGYPLTSRSTANLNMQYEKQNQKNTVNKIPPLPKRLKKQYMELYPVKVSQVKDIVNYLMSLQEQYE